MVPDTFFVPFFVSGLVRGKHHPLTAEEGGNVFPLRQNVRPVIVPDNALDCMLEISGIRKG